MKRKLKNSQLSNYQTFLMYFREMLVLAENVFEFKNLPDIIDISYLNKELLHKGSIAFFYDDGLDSVVALPYTSVGKLDIYGRPRKIKVFTNNGSYYRTLNENEFVIMYDNNGRYPLYLDIRQMALRIANCVRVEDVNISQQKTPRIWKTSTNNERTLRDLLNQYDGDVESIATYDSIEVDNIESVIAPAPFVTDKLDIHLDKLWAEFYRLIGIASVTEQKKERIIKDEMIASQGGTIASRYSRFSPREYAIKMINKKWGDKLDKLIEVEYYDGEPTTTIKEDDINETISISNDDSEFTK